MENHSSILAWLWREKRSLQSYSPHSCKESVKSEQWSTHIRFSILWFRKTDSNYFVVLHSQCTVSKIWLMSEKSDEESMLTLTCHRLHRIQLHLHFHWPELNHMALNQLWEISLSLSLVTQLCPTLATQWTIACQVPLSKGFSRQEYWSRLPFPSPLRNIGSVLIFVGLSFSATKITVTKRQMIPLEDTAILLLKLSKLKLSPSRILMPLN